ncbi:dynamin family protein [Synechocystis sp. LEGE 06083]|uniref:dynamin family protein n=1 Tax=Synechocystis sp. LEGE 06083 TaxID=915336 RepID=UPI001880BAD3|nr:dynamin family protein [Synechocystis sp. LEGE 06083]MBE9196055.1 dynamin family protein [Synechocystis sp. LEGE 06083]
MTTDLDNNESLKPSIFGLQQDVIFCLGEIAELMGQAKELLSRENVSDNSSAKYSQYQQEIKDALKNVKQLELRMAVVAPMKAGKSTIVNAIIGQELLPSRNAAMTTLPTEIVFKRDLVEPCLIISDEVRQTFQSAIESIQQEIKGLDKEAIREKISQYPHLVELIQEIEANHFQIPRNDLSGQERITEVLTFFNDIVRLSSVINPLLDPLAHLTEVIRIETPYLHTEDSKEQEQLGNLVVVDTPGPNEAGENLRLTMVVEKQLENSAIVLIVLDFTQLNNEAADKVKKQVQPIIDLIGKDNLYVLVNKVDQRRRGDMTSEQVKEFVYADLDLSESAHTDKVFEVSAIRAFSAARFMLESQRSKQTQSDDKAVILSSAETLAQEVLGMDWEEELDEITVEELYHKAKRLWEKSGFAPFPNKAINMLMENAAPKTIYIALNKARERLMHIDEDIKIRNKNIKEQSVKLQKKIEILEADLHGIEVCKSKLQKTQKIEEQLNAYLDKLLQILQEEAKVSISKYFGNEDTSTTSIDIALQDVRKMFVQTIEGFDPLGFSKRLRDHYSISKAKNSIDFDTKREADSFTSNAVAWAQQRAERMLLHAQKDFGKKVNKELEKLKKEIEKETKPIIDKARKRLSEDFRLELTYPTLPSWDTQNLGRVNLISSENFRQKTVERKGKKKPFYFLWLIEVEYTYQEQISETYYCVSMSHLTAQFNQGLSSSINNIKKEIKIYLQEDFKNKLDEYFEGLYQYFGRYRDILKQSQQDQSLSSQEQEELIQNLESINPKIEAYIFKTNTLLKRTQDFMEYID